jgi:cell wall-associated NlpC family hydrolase
MKKSLIVGLILGGLILGFATPATAATIPVTQTTTLTYSQKINIVVNYALAQQGDDYRWGAAGPDAFDCSGLVLASYKRIGIYLPHYSGYMLRYGWRVSRYSLRRGDIIWPYYGHVQLYIGNGYVVEASSSRDAVVVRKMWGFWTARRLL